MNLRYSASAALLIFNFALPLCADQVLMKDGTLYRGKILIDTDKAILIGNPPFDPNSYLLQAEDIEKIIYEEYHQNPPAERKRGFLLESGMSGGGFSSDVLLISPAMSFYTGAGFRVHPLFEIDGGVAWYPGLHAGSKLSVEGATIRSYDTFWMYGGVVSCRLYPFFRKTWMLEPYAIAGYAWNRLIPKGSGDKLTGAGWHAGAGFIRPLTTHIFLDARVTYQSLSFDSITFQGQDGTIRPEIDERIISFFVGASYRF